MDINSVNIKTLKEYDDEENENVSYEAISSEERKLLAKDEMASSKQKHKVSKIAHKEKEAEKKGEETVESKPSFVYPDIPFFQCSALQKLKAFRKRLQYIGPYKEALVARQDLKNRRQLCKVDKVVGQPPVYPTQQLDTDLF